MNEYKYITLAEMPEIKNEAADWFHNKWGVPKEAYLECMDAYLKKETEYGWYLCIYKHRYSWNCTKTYRFHCLGN